MSNDPSGVVKEHLAPYYLTSTDAVINNITAFNRYRIRSESTDPAMSGPFYIFMTSPSCNIETDGNMNWSDDVKIWKGYPNIRVLIDNLCYNVKGHNGVMPMLTILTNMVESFSPADTSSQTITVGETWSKLKQVYAGPDNDSKSGGTFNIEFNELEGMPVTILNKIWYEYSQAVRLGRAQPQQNARNKKYVDYMSSCYYFQLAPDGMSINYWCRFTGVFPTGLPFSSFSGKTGSELIRVSMPYSYMFKEDMLVSLLYEFNKCFNPNLGSGETTIERFKSVFGSESKTYGSNAFNVPESRATPFANETFMSESPFVYWRKKKDGSIIPCLDFGPGQKNQLLVFQGDAAGGQKRAG